MTPAPQTPPRAQPINWPFPPAGGPVAWTRQQIAAYERQQREQLPKAPL